MTRLSKFMGAGALLALAVGSVGCKPSKGTASPEDYYPLILVAMDSGKTAAMIGRNEFVNKENFAGCVSMEALMTGFDGAGDVLAGKMSDTVTMPGFELDLAECMALKPEQPQGNEEIAPLIEGVASVALSTAEFYAGKIKSTNCKKGTAALGAIAYIKGLVEPVAKQIAEPGGPLVIPSMTIDLAACGE